MIPIMIMVNLPRWLRVTAGLLALRVLGCIDEMAQLVSDPRRGDGPFIGASFHLPLPFRCRAVPDLSSTYRFRTGLGLQTHR